MPFSLRLDPATEARIRRLATASGQSKSAIVRDAVARYAPDSAEPLRSGPSAFDRLRVFVGSVRTGGRHFSRDTHAKYRLALARKHRGRRSR